MPEARQDIIRNCADYLALTVGEVMSIAATAPRRYFVWHVDKRSGSGKRTLCHPARELKPIQYYFLHHILNTLAVHPAATAYVSGSSIKKNAAAHAHSRVILKLDFMDFFNSLTVENWRRFVVDQFAAWTPDEVDFSCKILFWGAHSRIPTCLAIGAPTSPLLSNALMFEVDVKLQAFAEANALTYTRYADDITFSSRGELNRHATISAVQQALARAVYTSVRVKSEKTALVSNKSCRRVTGLVITPDHKISLGRDRKRLISAMVHHAGRRSLSIADTTRLSGLLAFAMDVEPAFIESLRKKYSPVTIEGLLKLNQTKPHSL